MGGSKLGMSQQQQMFLPMRADFLPCRRKVNSRPSSLTRLRSSLSTATAGADGNSGLSSVDQSFLVGDPRIRRGSVAEESYLHGSQITKISPEQCGETPQLS